MLWAALQNYKLFLQKFIALPIVEIPHLTYPTIIKVCHTVVALAKVVLFKLDETFLSNSLENEPVAQESSCPQWNILAIARHAELPVLVRHIQDKLKDLATGTVSQVGEPHAMAIFSFILGTVMSGYDKRMKEVLALPLNETTVPILESSISQDQIPFDIGSTIFPTNYASNVDFYNSSELEIFNQDSSSHLEIFGEEAWQRMVDDTTISPYSL